MKEAINYTEAERKGVQIAFRQLATTYRRHRRITLYCFLLAGMGWVVFALGLVMLAPTFSLWAAVPFLAGIAVYGGACLSMPHLVCPGCSQNIQLKYGPYCPDCGRRTLGPPRTFGGVHCTACGKSNLRGRTYFTTRFCTHCGVLLDEKGFCAFRGVLWVKGESV